MERLSLRLGIKILQGLPRLWIGNRRPKVKIKCLGKWCQWRKEKKSNNCQQSRIGDQKIIRYQWS